MSHQERTWVESKDEQTGLPRWDVSINGVAVNQGYIIQVDTDSFEVHYPHTATVTRPTLVAAQRRIEAAPPIMKGGCRKIAREVEVDPDEEMLSNEQAGEALGVSRFRVNAMVSNGRLGAVRDSNGDPLIPRSEILKYIESERKG